MNPGFAGHACRRAPGQFWPTTSRHSSVWRACAPG